MTQEREQDMQKIDILSPEEINKALEETEKQFTGDESDYILLIQAGAKALYEAGCRFPNSQHEIKL
jgi:hypothetical protein